MSQFSRGISNRIKKSLYDNFDISNNDLIEKIIYIIYSLDRKDIQNLFDLTFQSDENILCYQSLLNKQKRTSILFIYLIIFLCNQKIDYEEIQNILIKNILEKNNECAIITILNIMRKLKIMENKENLNKIFQHSMQESIGIYFSKELPESMSFEELIDCVPYIELSVFINKTMKQVT